MNFICNSICYYCYYSTIELHCIIILLHQVFNPNLIGYSTGTGEFISTNAKLNIAFPVAATEDAFQQARILVQRIKSNPKINVKKQWKVLITVIVKFHNN